MDLDLLGILDVITYGPTQYKCNNNTMGWDTKSQVLYFVGKTRSFVYSLPLVP